MAIRRPPTTFSDSITGADLASDIAISTTGNIATTGSGTLTVAGNTTLSGTNNLGSNPTVTLGSNATFPDSIYIAGTGAFMARFNSSAWIAVTDGGILAFNDDSTGDSYDTDGNFNTGTYKYEVPATGVYYFFYAIYTAQNDSGNAFGFTTNNGEIANQNHGAYFGTYVQGTDDHMQTCSHILNLTSGDTVWVSSRGDSDVYPGHSYWGGCRLK